MIKSLWKITFTPATGPRVGEEILLLDHGDLMEAEPKLPVAQEVSQTAPLFSPWGHVQARGGAKTQASWTRRREVLLPRSQALLDQLLFPWGHSGTLTVEIAGGATFAWDRSAVSEITPTYPTRPGALLTQEFSAQCGPMRLVAGPLPASRAATWNVLVPGVCENWEDITTNWEDILTTPVI